MSFDQLCTELGIEHRLTPPKSPQTNGKPVIGKLHGISRLRCLLFALNDVGGLNARSHRFLLCR